MQKNRDEETIDDAIVEQITKKLRARSQRAIVGWVLGAIVTGSGLIVTGALESIARPNPFTKLDGDRLERRIDSLEKQLHTCWGVQQGTAERLNNIESDDSELRDDLKDHMRRHQ